MSSMTNNSYKLRIVLLVASNITALFSSVLLYYFRVNHYGSSIERYVHYALITFIIIVFISTLLIIGIKGKKIGHIFVALSYCILFLVYMIIVVWILDMFPFVIAFIIVSAIVLFVPIFLSMRLKKLFQFLIGIVLIILQILASLFVLSIFILVAACDRGEYLFVTANENVMVDEYGDITNNDGFEISFEDIDELSKLMEGQGYSAKYVEAGQSIPHSGIYASHRSIMYQKSYENFDLVFSLDLIEKKMHFVPVEIRVLDLEYAQKEVYIIIEKMRTVSDFSDEVEPRFYDQSTNRCLS